MIGAEDQQDPQSPEDDYTEVDSCLSFFGVKEETLPLEQHHLKIHCLERIPGAMVLQGADLTGLKIWPGADALCRYLYSNQTACNGQRVLELGAGTGLCGLFARKLGAASVHMTDISELALRCLQRNIQANCSSEELRSGEVKSFHLLWGQPCAHPRHPNQQQYDLILGSEVAYAEDCVGPLFVTVNELLSQDLDSKFVISHCARFDAVERAIEASLRLHNMHISETLTSVPRPASEWINTTEEGPEDVLIMIIKRGVSCNDGET